MIAKLRNLSPVFTPTHISRYKNLLVSGCSMVWNNSEQHVCSWPYYLRDLARFEQVIDCSQSGAGTNHIFNSVINEIETNDSINTNNTLIIIMLSELSRTDVIADREITRSWHDMSNYDFSDKFSTLSIFNQAPGKTNIDSLCNLYKRIISIYAQVYESCLKIIALDSYLKIHKFDYVFVSWGDISQGLTQIVGEKLSNRVIEKLSKIERLIDYAGDDLEPDGHPTPNAYLGWTRQCLIPALEGRGLIDANS